MITLTVTKDVEPGWLVFELDGVRFAPIRPVAAVDGDLVIALSGRESSLLRQYEVRGARQLQQALGQVDAETLIVLLAICMRRAGQDKVDVEKLLDADLKLRVLMGDTPDDADPDEGVASAATATP